jgi:DnaK suppressor protein
MTKSLQDELRSILESRRDELVRAMHRLLEQLAVNGCGDSVDQMHEQENRNIAVQSVVRMSKELHDVKRALAKMQDGTFGLCDLCEEELTPKRLRAMPWARYCIVCQERRELSAEDAEAA